MIEEKVKAAGNTSEVVLEHFLVIPEGYRKAALMLFENSGVFGGRRYVGTGAAVGKAIKKELGWSPAMMSKCLKKLCECRFLSQEGRGSYEINPIFTPKAMEWISFIFSHIPDEIEWPEKDNATNDKNDDTKEEIEQVPGQMEITDYKYNNDYKIPGVD